MFDADNDGDLDIHVTNGHVIDNVKLYRPTLTYAQKDLLYENRPSATAKSPVSRRFRARRSGPAGDSRRPRAGGRGLRQRRQGRRRHDIAQPARGAVAELRARGPATGSRSARRERRATPSAWERPSRSRRRKGARSGRSTTPPATSAANDIRLHVGLGAAKSDSADRDCVAEWCSTDPERRRSQPDPDDRRAMKFVTLLLVACSRPARGPRSSTPCRARG